MAIMKFEKRPSDVSKIAGPAGTIIGGAAGLIASGGNPAGLQAGAAIGGAAGGIVAGASNKDAGQVMSSAAKGVTGVGGGSKEPSAEVMDTAGAMQRRLETQQQIAMPASETLPSIDIADPIEAYKRRMLQRSSFSLA